ncbi:MULTISPECIES: YicC/YloC family endoribonuclease [unclassified Legionella]|uniref:YicC/YloC family endoribonuclease n=1 Tax=unclassified Legionella TaxID=2622702 RepID=UPI001054F8B3|nr:MULTISPECIES: YicC/YloC family endoribonuclease [unclassified Legionella]MDI9819745.1 YicC/YloC family endoribonuclease [Legionella sp. PL877]
MTHSMTAFARIERQLDAGVFCWEIKSVNHRYLDVSFRLPEAFRFLEASLRSSLRGKITRGRLECQLKFQDASCAESSMLVNEGLADGLIKAGNQLAATRFLANDLSLSTVLAWPGVLQVSQPDLEIAAQQAEQLFQEALTQLLAIRKKEGESLKVHIKARLDKLKEQVKQARQQSASVAGQVRDKLSTRLNTLQLEVDNSRIEQEIALILTRLDISEELDRLQIHVDEVSRVLDSDEATGRRLDFLMQELNREANTLSSKSDSVALIQIAVEMKVLIDQMREQIQNIE